MTTPINRLLDAVEWERLDPATETDPGEVYATHAGDIEIAGFSFRCYQLNTGERVFDADDVAAFFGGTITPF